MKRSLYKSFKRITESMTKEELKKFVEGIEKGEIPIRKEILESKKIASYIKKKLSK